ncbi:MAG: monofunctional biosynthetic peptidoglycan transglycosylase [Thiomonas sp.]|uniref:monofunctional biosynthetic peptidoglycan transglycosylase n=1 Tax=Thiomonas sp. TaxID=2047785 RepID=UPI002A36E993|nr:monofunctional biosynthetic peptidoglycan transglycosylase [Thiomonas sp.]MDY0330854.1 monofunctional biosynthetic peptidoglycan transglycosylase [Thiomonas sp.]
MSSRVAAPLWRRLLKLLVLSILVLQAYFALRIALWKIIPPSSTTFMRAAELRILKSGDKVEWKHDWIPYDAISPHLKRAVVASEDATFLSNDGVDWDAIRNAWDRNHSRAFERSGKVVGGSTITQQLAKNLFLSPERDYLRKGQELIITFILEGILGKRRILEIYLNSVEWGNGIYGAQAAAQTYFHTSAARLTPAQAARLAVMLPAPRIYQKRLYSPYMNARTAVIAARQWEVQIPR